MIGQARGEAKGELTDKARPYVVVTADVCIEGDTIITLCPMTTASIGGGVFRVPVSKGSATGLKEDSEIATDRVTSIRRINLGDPVGTLSASIMARVDAGLRRRLVL